MVQPYKDRLLILESWMTELQRPDLYWQFYQEINYPACMPFNFELLFMEWQGGEIQKFLDAFQAGLRPQDCPVYVLGNHDQPRFASKVGQTAAPSGALLLLALPG